MEKISSAHRKSVSLSGQSISRRDGFLNRMKAGEGSLYFGNNDPLRSLTRRKEGDPTGVIIKDILMNLQIQSTEKSFHPINGLSRKKWLRLPTLFASSSVHFCLRPLASRRPSSRFGNLAEVPWVKVQKVQKFG